MTNEQINRVVDALERLALALEVNALGKIAAALERAHPEPAVTVKIPEKVKHPETRTA